MIIIGMLFRQMNSRLTNGNEKS